MAIDTRVKIRTDHRSPNQWDNELDVVISYQSRVTLVSCKAGKATKINKEHLAELYTLASTDWRRFLP